MHVLGLRVQGLGFTLNLCSARVSDVWDCFRKVLKNLEWVGGFGFRVKALGFGV